MPDGVALPLLVQVSQLKRGAAQATERVRTCEATLRRVKELADEDRETLRCVFAVVAPNAGALHASTHSWRGPNGGG